MFDMEVDRLLYFRRRRKVTIDILEERLEAISTYNIPFQLPCEKLHSDRHDL